jgi:phosphate:Na+ symporter
VIGANLGTTVKAILAALGATPNARRAAAAHVLFNAITAAVALALLPWLVDALLRAQDALGLDRAPAATLALFHTVFNVLGVLLMWPLTPRLAAFLQARFRSAEEDESRPLYLDANSASVPAVGLDALEREVRRLGGFALRLALRVLADPAGSQAWAAREEGTVQRLGDAVGGFVEQLHAGTMTAPNAERLARTLRVLRYYESVAELAAELGRTGREPTPSELARASMELAAFRDHATRLIDAADPGLEPADHEACSAAVFGELEERYQALKSALLQAGAAGAITVASMEVLLRRASLMRRLTEQALKACRTLLAPAGQDRPRSSPAP